MNAAVMTQSCPTEEVLAAFIDRRLGRAARLAVVRHVAECDDCRDLIAGATEIRSVDDAPESREVANSGSLPRVWAPLAAAAAVALVVFGVPSIRERVLGGTPMRELEQAANGLAERPVEGRLSGGFAYKEHRPRRGNADGPADLTVHAAAADAAEQYEKAPNSAASLHSLGVASLLLEHTEDAVPLLERAAQADPASAAILTDLSAAYIERGEYEKALRTATRALQLERRPAAAWNRALALKWLERYPEAIAAWQEYLELDPSSEWSAEARRNLEDAQELQAAPGRR